MSFYSCTGNNKNKCGTGPCHRCQAIEKPEFLTKPAHFETLKLREKVFYVKDDVIESLNFAGFNPMSDNLVMFVSGGNVEHVITVSIRSLNGLNPPRILKNYDLSKKLMLENAKRKITVLEDVYFNEVQE